MKQGAWASLPGWFAPSSPWCQPLSAAKPLLPEWMAGSHLEVLPDPASHGCDSGVDTREVRPCTAIAPAGDAGQKPPP